MVAMVAMVAVAPGDAYAAMDQTTQNPSAKFLTLLPGVTVGRADQAAVVVEYLSYT